MANGTDARVNETKVDDDLELAIGRLEEKVAHAAVLVHHRVTAMAAAPDRSGRNCVVGLCACSWRSSEVHDIDDVVIEHRGHLRPLIAKELGRPVTVL